METMLLLEHQPNPSRRLGRHVRHDPVSRLYPAPMAGEITSVVHTRHVPVFDQGNLGSCTGNAGIGCIGTGPFTHAGNEAEAVDVYSEATTIDDVNGQYPPTDTGSSGLAVMKVLKRRALIKGYTHTFDFGATMRALVLRPGIVGITWKTGCDTPDKDGIIRWSGAVRGGHELVVDAIDVPRRLVRLHNSWGLRYGLDGAVYMTWIDFQAALNDHGDATFPLV